MLTRYHAPNMSVVHIVLILATSFVLPTPASDTPASADPNKYLDAVRFGDVVFDEPIKRLDYFGMSRRKVAILSDVFTEVVQPIVMISAFAVVEDAYQFPIAVMHGHGRRQPLGRIAVARNECEHRATIHLFATKSRR